MLPFTDAKTGQWQNTKQKNVSSFIFTNIRDVLTRRELFGRSIMGFYVT